MQTIKDQFHTNIELNGLIPIFEIGVIDRRTNSKDYVVFDISVQDNNFVAQRIGLNKAENENDKIATTSIEIDEDFSVDENLQELYSACIQDIMDSDFYELAE